MKKENMMLVLLIIIIGGVMIYSFSGIKGNSSEKVFDQKTTVNKPPTGLKSVETGSTDAGDVSVELTPHKIQDGKLEIDISINTHSVDLSGFDLKQITTLKIADKSLKPISAPNIKGHHTSGTLVFSVNDTSESFTIIILGIPKLQERVFTW